MIAFRGQFESGPEHIPNKAEVLQIINKLVDGEKTYPIRECEDELGLYLLEVEVKNVGLYEKVYYQYRRKGAHQEISSADTAISKDVLDDGEWFGVNLAYFNQNSMEWDIVEE